MLNLTDLPPLRTRVYIDGYNFYYGCLRGTACKWLDLLRLFEVHILPSVLVTDAAGNRRNAALLTDPAVKYFTAKIVERVAKAPDSVSSQARYHTALTKLHGERLQLVEGYYAVNEMKVKLVDPQLPGRAPRECAEALAWKVEEKQSDVNLALHAYHDAITGAVDQVVIVTNDTDIAPALQMIRSHTQVRIGLVIPTVDQQRRPNGDLLKLAHWVRGHVTLDELARSQLPRVIAGRKPTIKPVSWYAQPDLLQQVLELAIPVRGSSGAVFKWLEQPNAHLQGRTPLDMLETREGGEQVLAYIHNWLARSPTASD